MPIRLHDYASASVRDDLAAAKASLSASFLSAPDRPVLQELRSIPVPAPDQNIIGVGVGEKTVLGRLTGVLCIKFLVRMKFTADRIAGPDLLPGSVDAIPTDVEEIGWIRPLTADTRARVRPVRAGLSVGYRVPDSSFSMAGTVGGIVRDPQGYHILSNSHVLSDEGRLDLGAPIFQPGVLDGGAAADEMARLSRFVPLDAGGPNHVDAAIARLEGGVQADPAGLDGVAPLGSTRATISSSVEKFGRTSGFTVGTVTSVDTDIRVPYETGSYLFVNQIAVAGGTTPFSAPGDSGSLILDRTSSCAVGLLFSGSDAVSFANPIDEVLAALAVELVTAGSSAPGSS